MGLLRCDLIAGVVVYFRPKTTLHPIFQAFRDEFPAKKGKVTNCKSDCKSQAYVGTQKITHKRVREILAVRTFQTFKSARPLFLPRIPVCHTRGVLGFSN